MSLAARVPTAAGRGALRLYAGAPAGVRAHVHVRWWSAPFVPVADALPRAGRILEIGCGHGLFSAYAALAAPGREVVGVDIDPDKIRAAKAAARRWDPADGVGRLSFAVAPSGAVPPGPWDAVVVVDMLYLLPEAGQRRLLEEAVAALAPGGRLVVKEMGTEPRWKLRWNTWQETLSVKVLRITAGSSFDFVDPAETARWLEELGMTTATRRLDRGRLHPHHLLVGTLPG
ncbi:class I SAM-dependent methyltransferase [Cellulomonas fimi]|uniref:Class I SAM-dependent methyltransferase n=1 Tax=Cellulomonas fimi TaxID=1708 RepID=A0A7Y0LWU3_CELFI|nr:methyltransferase domain-containing protein [Cellulomonas fimi]NMR19430.1 class I SAM-dependent methyltransferase [Cellulomonas fimi]